MSFSFKHYAFAATALAGVYSAQLSVGFFQPDDAVRTIAQVEEQVVLTAENIVEEINKKSLKKAEKLEAIKAQLAKIEEVSDSKELKALLAQHKADLKAAIESHDIFKTDVENFIAAQEDTFDISAIEESMMKLSEEQLKLISEFNNQKFEEAIVVAKDKEEAQRDEKISSLEQMLCQQKESLTALKDELSEKLSKLTDLISSTDQKPEPTIYDPGFAMPWAQMPMPFQMMMNPFSFLMGSNSQQAGNPYSMGMDPGFGLMDMSAFGLGGSGMTQNNFYGPTSFNAFNSMMMPQRREPSQSDVQQNQEGVHVPPEQAFVPYFHRTIVPEVSATLQ